MRVHLGTVDINADTKDGSFQSSKIRSDRRSGGGVCAVLMLILSAMLMLMMAQRSFDDKTGAFQERVRVAKKWVASMLVVLQEHLW